MVLEDHLNTEGPPKPLNRCPPNGVNPHRVRFAPPGRGGRYHGTSSTVLTSARVNLGAFGWHRTAHHLIGLAYDLFPSDAEQRGPKGTHTL